MEGQQLSSVCVCVCVCVHFIYSRDVFCSTVATCTIMYVIMRGGAWVGGASEAVNIVKCLLLETTSVLVEAGYIRITAGWVWRDHWSPPWYVPCQPRQIFGRLKSLLI